MPNLNYMTIMSLDGYIEDESGKFDWAVPGDEAHSFINDLSRPAGTFLYGRRMYETMTAWETEPSLAESSPEMRDFAGVWQAAEKIVYSRSLTTAITSNTRIERKFDPDAVRQIKADAKSDLMIGGPEIASHAFRAGLIDECQIFIAPVIVGGGKTALPDNVTLKLDLVDQRTFSDGMVYLRYRAG